MYIVWANEIFMLVIELTREALMDNRPKRSSTAPKRLLMPNAKIKPRLFPNPSYKEDATRASFCRCPHC